MFLTKIFNAIFGRRSVTATMKDSVVDGDILKAKEVEEKSVVEKKEDCQKDNTVDDSSKKVAEVIEEKPIEYSDVDINDKIFIADLIRPIVKKYNISDEYQKTMEDINMISKTMKTFANITVDENGNAAIVINFTQSAAYNVIPKFCEFINNTIYKALSNKLADLGDYDDTYRYVLSIKDSSIIINKIKK